MMKRTKKKGYVLAVVIILALVMTIMVTFAFTIIMRYMLWAKDKTSDLSGQAIYNCINWGGIF